MDVPKYEIRELRIDEVPQALALWKATELQEGNNCLYTWMEVDPHGILAAVSETGKVLGVCSAVVHHEDLAFIGCYVVAEQYRGKGIGVKLWKSCMEHIGTRNAGVNAVPGKLEVYRDRGGFPLEETGWFSIATETETGEADPTVLLESIDGVEVRPISEDEFPLVMKYDHSVIEYDRTKIIKLSIAEKDSVSYLAIKDGQCVGYGIYKLGVQGHGLVGPLYADSQDIAEVILRKLIENLPQGKGTAIMIISTHEGARSILNKLQIPLHEECPRCYKNHKVDADINKVFGQLNLNFSPY